MTLRGAPRASRAERSAALREGEERDQGLGARVEPGRNVQLSAILRIEWNLVRVRQIFAKCSPRRAPSRLSRVLPSVRSAT